VTARQLTFDLGHDPAQGREAFFVGPSNAVALAALDGWERWPNRRMLLVGPSGSGKSHLAAIWAGDVEARRIEGFTLAMQGDLTGLAGGPVVVENAEDLAGERGRESSLFHLWNLMGETGQPLLITSAQPPRDWGIALPDLASRLQSAPVTRLEPPDDALLSAVLVKLFADRQLTVDPVVITWLLQRMDRSIAAARDVVGRLDHLSLQRRAPVSRGMAAEILDFSSAEAD
jgi:chromosomal replication initiation ATPase DnaA